MSMEQYDWLERKGVTNIYMYDYYEQDDKYVYLKRYDIGLIIKRAKDIVGWMF